MAEQCKPDCGCVSRRDVLASAVLLAMPMPAVLGAASGGAPAKDSPGAKPSREWVAGLFRPDRRKIYSGNELETIGMPCGGVAAGQLYVRGDGTLAYWWIFNNVKNTGFGDKCYRTYRPDSPLEQGFAIRVKPANGPAVVRKLSRDDFDGIEFIGEYPIAEVRYRTQNKPALPVEVRSEVFSPFIPLNARDSGMPVTVLRFSVKNTSSSPAEVSIAGWLQNGVLLEMAGVPEVRSRNRVARGEGLTSVRMDLVETNPGVAAQRRVEVFEDFEKGYEKWTATGDAFGDKPVTGTLPNQQQVSGWRGKQLVNTFRGGDAAQGTLTSAPFKIAQPFITFLIGGGNHPGKTCINLLIDGKVARTSTGHDSEALRQDFWKVGEFIGKEARIEIVDKESGPWGHINIDHICFTNMPPNVIGNPRENPGFGDMSITAVDGQATATAAWNTLEAMLSDLAEDGKLGGEAEQAYEVGAKRCGAVASAVALGPGEEKALTFLVSWYFPNRANVGNMYANWFKDSVEVAQYVAKEFPRLYADTKAFRDCYLDTTLPYWFMARLMMPLSTLATETCQWWKSGRFYAWEGVGCCHGTCTHVWNYDHAGARLFPELERSTRLMQDLGVALNQNTGLVGFRGAQEYAADGQVGTVLKTYREHLMSADNSFLDAAWPKVVKALEFSISHDGNGDGLIEDSQHNTYDINFEGPNTFVGSLYLAALRAGEEMAKIKGDTERARKYREIFEKGMAGTVERLWNGEYFVQRIPAGKADRFQYGDGCMADQVFGQGWAHQLGMGYIYPKDKVLTALASVFKYNWTSDTGPYNKVWPPQRWFIGAGEAGLFICTWPKGGRPNEPVLYRDEVWTGIEYQVANHMLYEGMLPEAFAIVRGVHERYDGAKHNPWNEVECGDHYARAMASWGCLLGVEGYVYDGPAGKIGFAPRLTPENFKACFTAAEGWGSLVQKREGKRQVNRIDVRWGKVRAGMLVFEVPVEAKNATAAVAVGGREVGSQVVQDGTRVTLKLVEGVVVEKGQGIEARLEWA